MSVAVGILGILGSVFVVLKYIIGNVTQPLNTAITQLNNVIIRLDETIKSIDARQHEIEKRLAIVENVVQTLHRRLDEFEMQLNNHETDWQEWVRAHEARIGGLYETINNMKGMIKSINGRIGMFATFYSHGHSDMPPETLNKLMDKDFEGE